MKHNIWIFTSLLVVSVLYGKESSSPSITDNVSKSGIITKSSPPVSKKETGKEPISEGDVKQDTSSKNLKESAPVNTSESSSTQAASINYVLNEVRAIVYGPTSTALILTLDIKPTLELRPRTLRDLVLEELMLIEAGKLRMTVTEEDLDRYFKQLQKVSNLSLEQLTQRFAALGYSLEEAREQIRRRETLERLLSFKVRNNKAVKVTPTEIEEYWKKNPEKEEASFVLQMGTLKSDKSLAEVERALKKKKSSLEKKIDWGAPFTVKDNELAQDKQFIRTKRPDDIVLVEPEGGSYSITKLVSRIHERIKPFKSGDPEKDKKRVEGIRRILTEQKLSKLKQNFDKLKRDYEEELLKKGHIVFKYEADRKEVYSPGQ